MTELKKIVGDTVEISEYNDQGLKVSFPYRIPIGRFRGQQIDIGFLVPNDFPAVPPGGPHVRPPLIRGTPNGTTHQTRSHESLFGREWEYWSRPYLGWGKTEKSVQTYMAFVRRLFKDL